MISSKSRRFARVGHVCETVLGKMLQTTAKAPDDQEVPYLRAGLLDGLVDLTELPTMFASQQEVRTHGLRKGDLLVAEGGDVGRSEFAPRLHPSTIFQNSLHRVRVRDAGDIRFVRYALASISSSGWLDVLCNRATFGHLTVEKLRQLQIPWPEPSEQRAIADFLDTETERIDTLISKKRRLAELLEERRRTLITQAVTGQHPPPTQPAGGDRPGDQRTRSRTSSPTRTGDRVATLRRLASTTGGSGFPHAEQGHDHGDYPFFKVSDFNHIGNERVITICANWVSKETAHRLRATVVPAGSVLLPKVGAALLGNARRIVSQPSVFDNNVLGVVPHAINSRYLHYWLTTIDSAQFSKPGPVPSMDDRSILDLRVPIVSSDEQRAIADFLDTETERIDRLVEKINRTIELLQERRRSLITAAVTGELPLGLI